MIVEVHRNETNVPIVVENVISSYTKGPLFCITYEKDGKKIVDKYPLCSIFRIREPYS